MRGRLWTVDCERGDATAGGLALRAWARYDGDKSDDSVQGMIGMAQEIMTSAEAAQYLRLGIDTLKRKARAGDIPAAKIGRSWRFRKPELDAWLSVGGDRYERMVDEGLGIVMRERMADPANEKGMPLEEFLRERGL